MPESLLDREKFLGKNPAVFMSFSTELILNGGALGLADVELVARQRASVKLGAKVLTP